MCFGIEKNNPRYPAAPPVPFQFWVNPEITWSSEETSWMWEGCLSVPGMRGWVQRPREIRMRGLDEQGNAQEVNVQGLAARIAQQRDLHFWFHKPCLIARRNGLRIGQLRVATAQKLA